MHAYESLLNLVDRTSAELVDLAPRDRSDIQSFIWVVGNYMEQLQSKIAMSEPLSLT